jgi:hypothetical protein
VYLCRSFEIWTETSALAFFDTYNSIFPLYDKATFYQNYDLQYSGKPPSDVGWYASLNIVLCLGNILSEIEDKTHISAGEETWKKYFRNVTNRFADLLFEESSLFAIQAICGMVRGHLCDFRAKLTLPPGCRSADGLARAGSLRSNGNRWAASLRNRTTPKFESRKSYPGGNSAEAKRILDYLFHG